MEFYSVASVPAPASWLHQFVRVETLSRLCASIDRVLSGHGERGEIYCIWGQFRVRRETLRDGVRFTLPGCPNALQWTITADNNAQPGSVLIHCTINRREHEPDFVASIEQFVSDWKDGLERGLAELRAESVPTPAAPTIPWFG